MQFCQRTNLPTKYSDTFKYFYNKLQVASDRTRVGCI